MIWSRSFLMTLCLSGLLGGALGCGTSAAASKRASRPEPTSRSAPTSRPPASASRPPASGAPPLVAEMLAAHNAARAAARPAPSPALPALTWSEEAARVAQAYANQCRFEHNAKRGPYGENLAAAAPPGSKTNAQVVSDWTAEAADYSFANHQCAPGKVCGHYTQVVWRQTTQVGCAVAVCTKNSPFGPQFPQWELWVCDYSPPGNYVGERPY